MAKRLYESLQDEAQQAIAFAREMEQKDAALAMRLTNESSNSSDAFLNQKDRQHKDHKNSIDKYVQVLSVSSPINPPFPSSSSCSPTLSSSNTAISLPRQLSQSISHSHYSMTSKNKSITGSSRSSSSSHSLSKNCMLTFLVQKEASRIPHNPNLIVTGDNYLDVDKASNTNNADNDFDTDDASDFDRKSYERLQLNTNVFTSSSNNSGTSGRHLNCKNYSENTGYDKNTRNHGDRCQYVNNDDDSEHVWFTSKSSSLSDLRKAVINTNHTTVSSKNNDANEDEDDIEIESWNKREKFKNIHIKRKIDSVLWSCTACTFANISNKLRTCAVCGTARGKNTSHFPNKKINNEVSFLREAYVTVNEGASRIAMNEKSHS